MKGAAVKQEHAFAGTLTRHARIRRLGFDPAHLTPDEQEELLASEAILPVPNPLPNQEVARR